MGFYVIAWRYGQFLLDEGEMKDAVRDEAGREVVKGKNDDDDKDRDKQTKPRPRDHFQDNLELVAWYLATDSQDIIKIATGQTSTRSPAGLLCSMCLVAVVDGWI